MIRFLLGFLLLFEYEVGLANLGKEDVSVDFKNVRIGVVLNLAVRGCYFRNGFLGLAKKSFED